MGVRPVAAGRLHHPDPEAVCAEHLAPRPRLLGAGERHGPRHEQHRIGIRVERGDRGPVVVHRGLRADLHLAVAARRGLRPHAAEPEQRAEQSRRQSERQPPRTACRTRMPPVPHAARRRRGARRCHICHIAHEGARACPGMLCPANSPLPGAAPAAARLRYRSPPRRSRRADGRGSVPSRRRPAPPRARRLGLSARLPLPPPTRSSLRVYRRAHRPTSVMCAASARSNDCYTVRPVAFSTSGYGPRGGGAGRGEEGVAHGPTR